MKVNVSNLHTSQSEIDYIKQHEGLRLQAYQDSGNLWTIGYGSLTMPDGSPVQDGDVITEDQANAMLLAEVATFENEVKSKVKVDLDQSEFDGLVDFLFNTGNTNSDLFTFINNQDWKGAANFLKTHYVWDEAGHYLTALQNIRDTEAADELS